MSEWIVCGIQVTLMGLVTWLFGRLVMNRFPELTVTVSLVGLLGGACLVFATAFNAPRIVNLAGVFDAPPNSGYGVLPANASEPVAITQTESDSDAKQAVVRLGPLAGWLKFGVSLFHDSANQNSQESSNNQTAWGTAQWMFLAATLASLVAAFRCLLGIGAAIWFRYVSRIVEDQRLLAIRDLVASRMGVSQTVLLRQHARVDSPFVCWLTGWTVFLPTQAEDWDNDELSAAIAHELAHLKRCDTWIRFWGELAYTLVAWNPFYWLARRQCLVAQELAADQCVARQLQAGDDYLTGLSRLALRFDGGHGERFLMPGVCFSNHCLIRRIKMLKCFRMESQLIAGWLNQASGIAMVLVFVLTGAWTVSAQDGARNSEGQGQGQTKRQFDAARVQNDDDPFAGKIARTSYEETSSSLFNRPFPKPWETLGSQEGYFSIRFSELLSHKKLGLFESLLQSELSQTLLPNENGNGQNICDFGLQINEIELIEFPVSLVMNKRDDGLNQISLGNSGRLSLRVITANEVDWPGIAKSLSPSIAEIHPHWEMTKVVKEIQRQVLSGKELRLSILQPEVIAPNLEMTPRRQAMWNDVAGGIATAVVPFRCEPSSKEPIEFGTLKSDHYLQLLKAKLAVIAFGFDFLKSEEGEAILFSLEPVAGASTEELVRLCRGFVSEKMREMQENLSDESNRQSSSELERYISVLKSVSIESIGEGELARVRIQVSFPLIQGLLEASE